MERNTNHVNFKNKNLDNVSFVKITFYPAVGKHLTAKWYVDKAILVT